MRIPQIQGLRALAALLVTIFHARLMPGGFIGVDIFYVISGFLITGLILREIETTGTLNLSEFYQRRIKRLLPTSVFVLFVTAIIGFFILPAITRDALGRDLFAAATYSSNYLFAWWENDYQNLNATPSPFIHYWSLAVEEQFYLIWPIFIVFLAKFGRRIIFLGIAISTLASLLFSIYLTQAAPIWAFYSLPTRAWELGFGALLLFLPKDSLRNRFLPWLGFFALAFSSLAFDETTAFPGSLALIPVLGTAILIGSISVWPRLFNDLSNNKLMQWLGAISYPLYLWHWPALVLPSSALGRPLRIRESLLCIALTIFLAHYTSKWVEAPLRHRKISKKRVYQGFALTTAISLFSGIAIASTSSSQITLKDGRYSFDLNEVTAKPIVYDDGCHVNYGENKSGECVYGDLKASKTIVLYGDSHAAQWFPALEQLAKDRGFRLISLTKSACSSVAADRDDQGAYKSKDCNEWRSNSVERINEIKPAALIMSSFQYYRPPSSAKNRQTWWRNGQEKLLSAVKQSAPYLIYIADTPKPVTDIPNCLSSKNSGSCDSTEKTSVQVIDGFSMIDPNSWFCSSICPAIKDGFVVYRDSSHISVAAAISARKRLEAALSNIGIFS